MPTKERVADMTVTTTQLAAVLGITNRRVQPVRSTSVPSLWRRRVRKVYDLRRSRSKLSVCRGELESFATSVSYPSQIC